VGLKNKRTMKNLLIISLLLCSSCYTKRRAIEKFCQTDTTTITIHDTIYTETIKADSVFSESIDSVIITKDRLVVRYKKIYDKIYLSGECIGDTIYYTKEVKVPHIIEKPFEFKWWIYLLIFFSGTFFALFVTKK
jgi:hypothetical protein